MLHLLITWWPEKEIAIITKRNVFSGYGKPDGNIAAVHF